MPTISIVNIRGDGDWPGRGPWMIAATSAEVDWRVAAAAFAAAAQVPVAAVVVGAAVAGDDPARPHLAGLVELPEVGRLTLRQAHDLVVATARAYDVVLLAAPAGPLVAIGAGDWSLADLAAETNARALVVTGAGPDAVNHTTLALGALAGHGISASVVTIGDVDDSALPVTPAGRIPADPPDDLAGAAGWFDERLRETASGGPDAAPVIGRRPSVSGKRVVLALLGFFLALVVLVCTIAWSGRPTAEIEQVERRQSLTREPAPRVPSAAVPPPTRKPRPTDVCPQHAGKVTATRPDAATTARVNAAWQRIEKWLTARAPASARSLRPPATAAQIDELQRRMSVAFPPDLVASLRRHDGVEQEHRFTFPPFYGPSPVRTIFVDWEVTCGVLAGVEQSWPGDAWWDPDFVPVAEVGDGGSLLVDQRPGGHGRVGEFYPEDGTDFARWPASLTELLEKTAASLESGRPYDGRYRPRVTREGVLEWTF